MAEYMPVTPARASLDKLPLELLQRIISLGPCESILSLTKVNRNIHRACNDRQVFKAVIKTCNSFDGPEWKSIPLSNDSPLSAWARYALADSKARQWPTEYPKGLAELRSSFLAWAPQLMAASRESLYVCNKSYRIDFFRSSGRFC